MSTDSLLLMLPATGNWQTSAPGTPAASDTAIGSVENPAQFLQTLIAQMQRGEFQVPEIGKVANDAQTDQPIQADKPVSTDALEQLKAFISAHLPAEHPAAPVTATGAASASQPPEDGNSLPVPAMATHADSAEPAKPDPATLPSTPEQVLAYLAQWMAPQQPATTATPDSPAAQTTTESPPDRTDALPSADLLAQMLQAAGLKLDPPTQVLTDAAAQPETPTPATTSALIQPAIKTSTFQTINQPPTDASPTDETDNTLLSLTSQTRAPNTPVTHADFSKTLSQLERAGQKDMGLDFGKSPTDTTMPLALVQATERVSPELKATPDLSPEPTPALNTATPAPLLKAASLPVIEQPAPIQTPVGHPDWSSEIADRIVWMTNKQQGLQTADIKLNPAHLGPVEVRVNINQDQASVQFTSNHAAVREALESAVPKLREMLHGQNLNLADVNISQQSFNQQQRNDSPTAQFGFGRQSQPQTAVPAADGEATESTVSTSSTTVSSSRISQRLLSLYA